MMCRVIAPFSASSETTEAGDLPVDLRALMEEVADLLHAAAQEKGVEVSCVVPRTLPRRFLAQSPAIRRMLQALLGRAIVLADTGMVTLRVRVLRETDAQAELRFSVKPDRVADDAVPWETPADLSIVRLRQLVTAMGGRLGLDEEAGSGRILWCTLVLQKSATVAPPPAPAPSSGSRVAVAVRALTRRARISRHRMRRWFAPPVHPVPRRVAAWPQG